MKIIFLISCTAGYVHIYNFLCPILVSYKFMIVRKTSLPTFIFAYFLQYEEVKNAVKKLNSYFINYFLHLFSKRRSKT